MHGDDDDHSDDLHQCSCINLAVALLCCVCVMKIVSLVVFVCVIERGACCRDFAFDLLQ